MCASVLQPRTSSQPPPGHLVPVHRSSLSTENVSPCFHFESDSLLLHCGEDTPKNHMVRRTCDVEGDALVDLLIPPPPGAIKVLFDIVGNIEMFSIETGQS